MSADALPVPEWTCECDLNAGDTRGLYRVTNHDGRVAVVRCCAYCAGLAEQDWNGETASIVAIGSPAVAAPLPFYAVCHGCKMWQEVRATDRGTLCLSCETLIGSPARGAS